MQNTIKPTNIENKEEELTDVENNKEEEQLDGIHRFEQDDKSILECNFNKGKIIYTHIFHEKNNEKETISYFSFNEKGNLHGDIIIDKKTYKFDNGNMK